MAVPLYAFPPATVAGKPVDAATIFAGLLVLTGLATRSVPSTPFAVWLGLSSIAPLTVFLGGGSRATTFSLPQFTSTYLHWLLVIAFFVFASQLGPRSRDWTLFVRLQLVAGLAVTAFCFYQIGGRSRGWPATGHVISSLQRLPFTGGSFGGYERPTSFLLEPSYLGAYLSWLAILPLLMVIEGKHLTVAARAGYAIAFAAIVLAILSSVSFGAYVDLAAVVGVALWYAARRLPGRRRWWLGAALLGALGVVLAADAALGGGPSRAFSARLSQDLRVLRAGDYGALGTHRMGLHIREAQIAGAHPVTGVGLGQYRLVSPTVPGELPGTIEVVSGWLGAAAEMGFPGLLLLASALLIARRRSRSPATSMLIAFLVVNQLHAAGYVELTFWYPLAVCAVFAAGRH